MKTILVDDERLARQELRKMLESFPEVQVMAEFGDPAEAVEAIPRLQPDLLFLDISMPGMNGFELLGSLIPTPSVIFVTAHDDFALRAFEVNALDYLLKPVDPARLREALSKLPPQTSSVPELRQGQLESTDQVFVKDGEKCWFVKLEDIRLFESEGNYIRVYFGDNRPLILKSLNALEEKLSPKIFFRISRKHIVNLKWIDGIENWFNGGLMIKLRGGEKVEISRRQSARFKELMSL